MMLNSKSHKKGHKEQKRNLVSKADSGVSAGFESPMSGCPIGQYLEPEAKGAGPS